MLTKFIASFLVCTVALLTVHPVNNFAQAQLNTAAEQYLRETQAKQTPDLRSTFTAEMARIKAGTLTKADFERIQKASQNPKHQSSFPKRQKIFLALWIVVMTGLVVVLIKHPCKAKDPKDCEFIDDSNQY